MLKLYFLLLKSTKNSENVHKLAVALNMTLLRCLCLLSFERLTLKSDPFPFPSIYPRVWSASVRVLPQPPTQLTLNLTLTLLVPEPLTHTWTPWPLTHHSFTHSYTHTHTRVTLPPKQQLVLMTSTPQQHWYSCVFVCVCVWPVWMQPVSRAGLFARALLLSNSFVFFWHYFISS